jgi:hypothetical protein
LSVLTVTTRRTVDFWATAALDSAATTKRTTTATAGFFLMVNFLCSCIELTTPGSCPAHGMSRVQASQTAAGRLDCMNVRPDLLPHRELYRILIGTVVPRPIAWVSTLSDRRLNLAPFSFFNVVSAQPPLLGFSPSLRQVDGRPAPRTRCATSAKPANLW